ncbi:type-1 fimbrial protein A subunit [Caballeronia insecticola]|uniref:Type-1 fimbrial protein A subunit n=1 Tax=Caballeronia insecticola TaxID=758793 RepID=R4WZ45_9BURK|nr:type-1 fimbrial protein A subunit [Caballeronia insecticola]
MSLWRRCLVLMLFALAAPLSHAGVTCLGGLSGPFYIPAPPVTTIPPDYPTGSWIGGYTSYVGNTNGLSCTAAVSSPLAQQTAVNIPGGQSMQIDGVSYTVYPTGVSGLGVVLFATAYLDNTAYPEIALSGYNTYIVGAKKSFGLTYTKSQGVMVRARYVKTGPIAAGAWTLSSAQVLDSMPVTDWSSYDTLFYFAQTPVNVVVPGCTTGNVSIPMGKYVTTSFTGIGSRSSTVSFSVPLVCQSGINVVSYSINPTSGMIGSASNGVLQLLGPGAATGIGVRMANASDIPVTFNASTIFPGYTGAGTFSLPFTASYIQTAATVTAGPANASAVVTFQYQ